MRSAGGKVVVVPVRNVVVPSSAPLAEPRGEGQWCPPGLICQMLEGPVLNVGLGRLELMWDLGATQGKVNGGATGATPAALSSLKLWLLHKTLSLWLLHKTLSAPKQAPCSSRCSRSYTEGVGQPAGVGHWRSLWFESQAAEEEEECGLADRDGLGFPQLHIFLHWGFAVRVENVVGAEGCGATGGFGM